jgi:hypothetical protein
VQDELRKQNEKFGYKKENRWSIKNLSAELKKQWQDERGIFEDYYSRSQALAS